MIIQSIVHRFKITEPNPTKKDQATQMSLYLNEVVKMLRTLSCGYQELRQVADDFCVSEDITHDSAGRELTLPDDWKEQMLNALCNQIVTAIGVGYMMGFDMEKALAESTHINDSTDQPEELPK